MIIDAVFKEEEAMKADFGVLSVVNGGKCDYSLVANALKGSASGNPIRLDDVSPFAHEMAVGVKSKNLLPSVPQDGKSRTSNGVTFTLNDDGSLYINGTATAGTSFAYIREGTADRKPIKKGTYTISGANGLNGNNGRIVIGVTGVNEYYITGNSPRTVTVEEDNTMYFKVSIFQGATVDTTVYPMLELGDTASAYTKPIDVNGATVNKLGKNIWNFDDMTFVLGRSAATKTDNGIILSSTAASTWLYRLYRWLPISAIDNATAITLSCNMKASGSNKPLIIIRCVNEDRSIKETAVEITRSGSYTYAVDVKTLQEKGCEYFELVFYSNASDTACENGDYVEYSNFQIEIGTTATEYEPYHCETYTADENGNVDGIIGNGEDITLMADGAIITADYNRDINKAFEEINQKLTALSAVLIDNV